MQLLQDVLDPCPNTSPGYSTQLFLTLINALVHSKCKISSKGYYPPDYGPEIRDGDEFDFIVVGAGSAGSVVANKLSENPKWKVLVLEAGTYPSMESEIPIMIYTLQKTHEDWQYVTEPDPMNSCLGYKDGRCRWPRGKVLGGSSAINAMMYIRGNQRDYDQWAQQGNPGWDYKSMLKYFNQVEKLEVEELADSTSYGREGQLPLSQYHSNEPIVDAIKLGAEQLGYPSLKVEDSLGYFEVLQNIKDGVRSNSAKSFLGGGVLERNNLKVSHYSVVRKLIFDSNNRKVQEVAVQIGDKQVRIKATKEVILSAGSINSPQILMESGIGPKSHLEALGIDLVKDLKVGENLQDHLVFYGLIIKVADWAAKPFELPLADQFYEYFMHQTGPLSQLGITQFTGFVNTKEDGRFPNLQYHHFLYPQNDSFLLPMMAEKTGLQDHIAAQLLEANKGSVVLHIWPTLLNPKSKGRILLDPTNHQPLIYANYMDQSEDLETLLEGVRFVEQLLETEPMKKYRPQLVEMHLDNCRSFKFRSDDYWKCLIRHITSTLYHPVGTCKMSPQSDPTAVVDSRLRVHGIENLRVIDASIMPDITSGNTNAPAMVIGMKGGSMIVEDWQKQVKEEL